MIRLHPSSTLFPYTTLFRSSIAAQGMALHSQLLIYAHRAKIFNRQLGRDRANVTEPAHFARSEEHTSELQSPDHLVCRLLLEKKKKTQPTAQHRYSHYLLTQ